MLGDVIRSSSQPVVGLDHGMDRRNQVERDRE